MNSSNRKTTLLLLLAGIVLGSAGTYTAVQVKDKGTTRVPATNTTRDNESGQENSLGAKEIERDKTLPAGTLNPSEVTSKILEYKDKDVALRGLVVETTKDQYSITDQNPKGGFGIKLDFSKTSINPQDFANTGSKTSNPVTVKGKVTETKTTEGYIVYTLVVTSVDK